MGRSRRRERPAAKQNGNGGPKTVRQQVAESEANQEELTNILQPSSNVVQAGVAGGGLLAQQAKNEEQQKRRLSIGSGGGTATIPTNSPRGGPTYRGGIKIGGS